MIPPRHRRSARRVLLRTALGAAPALVLASRHGGSRSTPVVAGSLAASAALELQPAATAAVVVSAVGAIGSSGRRAVDLVGVAAGSLGSLATVLVLPRVSDAPARGAAVATRRTTEPSPDGDGLVIVLNDSSGPDGSDEIETAIGDALPRAELRRCGDGDDPTDALARAAAAGRSLGVVGGDGTVSAAARAALEADVPLVVFPGGTLNHFSRDLGIDVVSDSITAVREGDLVAIDVGMIHDRPFVNNASVGSYAALVDERERLEARLGKWPAMLVALARVLRRSERLEVTLDGDDRTVWMVFFGNGEYQPAGFAPSNRADLVDGAIDVRLIDAAPPWSRIRLVLAVLFGALHRSPLYERRVVSSAAVDCAGGGAVRMAADGETFDGPASFVVRKRPAALLVHVPREATDSPSGPTD